MVFKQYLDDIFKSWVASDPPVRPYSAFFRIAATDNRHLSTKNPRTAAWIKYVDLYNVGRSEQDKTTYWSVLDRLYDADSLKKSLFVGKANSTKAMLAKSYRAYHDMNIQDVTEGDQVKIQRTMDQSKLLQAETTNPSKRKTESPPEDARDGQRPRGE